MNDGVHPIDVLLARHLAGECTPAEGARVREWLRADPGRERELDDLRRAWAAAGRAEPAVDAAAAWERVRVRLREPVARPVLRPVAAHRPWRALLAAGVAIAATLGLWTVRGALRPATTASAPERRTTEYATGPGQRALVQLADGTQIALAPESHLRYVQPAADSGVRDAYLVGEAVFTVTHDPARPFVVHAKGAATVDIGTRFGVKAYADAPLRVAVAEGRVALADDVPGTVRVDSSLASLTALPRATLLAAGDVASRTDDRTETVTRNVNVDALLGWATGRLAFDRVPLRALVPDLERWYGLTVHVAAPALLDQRVSGVFESESRDEIIAALARALGARAERRGTTVTFTR